LEGEGEGLARRAAWGNLGRYNPSLSTWVVDTHLYAFVKIHRTVLPEESILLMWKFKSCQRQRLTPVILATQEAEIRGWRFEASQARSLKDPISKTKKNLHKKGLAEWLKSQSARLASIRLWV
jgi:hypothetical protein